MSYRIVLGVLGLLLSLTASAGEAGVVIEKIGSPSVLEKAGVQPGDVFLSWELSSRFDVSVPPGPLVILLSAVLYGASQLARTLQLRAS